MHLVAAASFSVQLGAASLVISCLSPVDVYHSSMNAGAETKDVTVGCLGSVYAFHVMLIAVLHMSLAHLRNSQPSFYQHALCGFKTLPYC